MQGPDDVVKVEALVFTKTNDSPFVTKHLQQAIYQRLERPESLLATITDCRRNRSCDINVPTKTPIDVNVFGLASWSLAGSTFFVC